MSALIIVPPVGLGGDLLLPALILSLSCLVGLLYLRQIGGTRGRVASSVLFCVLMLTLVLGAVELWSWPGW